MKGIMIMIDLLSVLPEETLITSVISASAILMGSIVGGVCSWIVTKKSMCRSEEVQSNMEEERRKHEEREKLRKICENAGIIRLDICTTLFQSIRSLKDVNSGNTSLYPIPVNTSYSLAVSSLESNFELKELSYIYQLYGVIEKLNNDIKNYKYNDEESYEVIVKSYELFLKKLYGGKYREILTLDIENLSYRDLYDNDIIKVGYRKVLSALDTICSSD